MTDHETRRRTIATLRTLAEQRPMSADRLREEADRLEADTAQCPAVAPCGRGSVRCELAVGHEPFGLFMDHHNSDAHIGWMGEY